jgi:hypothetical protein
MGTPEQYEQALIQEIKKRRKAGTFPTDKEMRTLSHAQLIKRYGPLHFANTLIAARNRAEIPLPPDLATISTRYH